MFPYFEAPAISVGPVTLHAFGMLVAAAILLGRRMLVRRAERKDWTERRPPGWSSGWSAAVWREPTW